MANEKPRLRIKPEIKASSTSYSKSSYQDINKVASESVPVSRLSRSELGYSGLLLRTGFNRLTYIEEEELEDLSWPQNLDTYSTMLKDDAVSIAIRAKNTLIIRALQDRQIMPGDADDEESVEAAKFVSWCLDNMDEGTFYSTLQDICTYNTYGFSALEKVWTIAKSGEYKGRVKIKKLASRSQRSLSTYTPVSYTEDGRKFLGLNQSRRNLPRYNTIPYGYNNSSTDVISIPVERLMMFSYEGYHNNVLGNSPLKGVYVAWKEKKLIEEYQVIGVTKDLGGTPLIKIPIEMLSKASADPASDEARTVETLMRDVANMHAGEQSYVILPSDYDETTKTPLFDVKLMGIEGSGKQFDLSQAIKDRKQAILDNFGAGFISLGNEGGGSHALMDGKTTVHEAFVEYDIKFITEVFENQLFPQLLALNGIKLPQSKMPRMKPSKISAENIDTVSKMIQRVFAVGAVPQTVEVTNEVLEQLGFEYKVPEGTTEEELMQMMPNSTSRSGDGLTSGLPDGVGESTASGGDTSVSNADNGGIEKSSSKWSIENVIGDDLYVLNNGKRSVQVMEEDLLEFIQGGPE